MCVFVSTWIWKGLAYYNIEKQRAIFYINLRLCDLRISCTVWSSKTIYYWHTNKHTHRQCDLSLDRTLRHHANAAVPIGPEGDTDGGRGFAEILEDHLPASWNSIHSPFSSPYSVKDWQHETEGVGDTPSVLTSIKPPTQRMVAALCQTNSQTFGTLFPLHLTGLFHPIKHSPEEGEC